MESRDEAKQPQAEAAGTGDNVPDEPVCANCGTLLTARFCPECGQRRGARLVSLRRLIADAVEDQFSLSSALPRTFGTLLFMPGRLTSEYLRGRIARYLPPFRLYLITSFIFFLTLQFAGGDRPIINLTRNGDAPALDADSSARLDTLDGGLAADSAAATAGATTPEEAEASVDEVFDRNSFLPERLREPIRRRAAHVARTQAEDGKALERALQRELLARAPVAIFLLIPVYALLLAAAYFRKRRFYVEHFIFALHVHAFAFLMFTGLTLTSSNILSLILMIWLLLYVLLAMRHVYRQGWLKTVAKYLVLGMVYSTLLTLAVVVIAFVALLVAPL